MGPPLLRPDLEFDYCNAPAPLLAWECYLITFYIAYYFLSFAELGYLAPGF